jgi:hypothetical protein
VASFDATGILAELRKLDEFTKKLEQKHGDLLPRAGN